MIYLNKCQKKNQLNNFFFELATYNAPFIKCRHQIRNLLRYSDFRFFTPFIKSIAPQVNV